MDRQLCLEGIAANQWPSRMSSGAGSIRILNSGLTHSGYDGHEEKGRAS